jgi:hypothetical protein
MPEGQVYRRAGVARRDHGGRRDQHTGGSKNPAPFHVFDHVVSCLFK